MGAARRTLLWASQNKWIERQFRRRTFARRAVARFMPGEDLDAALDAAQALRTHHVTSILTLLGENVTALSAAEQVTQHYCQVLDRIHLSDLPGQISVKLTQLGLDLDVDTCYRQVADLAAYAAERGNFVWIDMEGSAYTDVTLTLFERARASFENVGLCLQSYLRRTATDLERLLPLRPAIRLVKGAYKEPASLAFPRKKDVDANYVTLATRILDAAANGEVGTPAFGTHDTRLIDRVQSLASDRSVGEGGFEIQMLFGIGREQQKGLAAEGYRMRVLISYGSAWYPWYVRRLAERPANVWFVMRSAFRR